MSVLLTEGMRVKNSLASQLLHRAVGCQVLFCGRKKRPCKARPFLILVPEGDSKNRLSI
ncbi:hypothetical protein AN403_5893 [Pseudomonas fluorescens]|uniref:Uncharacterized protein n=1 Tax=Pseudomonas fluorescens TaxID=294 RepID=A0A0P8ZW62_PSEFL|nr:hypothetical protein AN403_5893 [Pseudomonas fluorescens]